jgi:serine protease Do/serine protease DegQ
MKQTAPLALALILALGFAPAATAQTPSGQASLAPMLKQVTPAVVNIAVTSTVEIDNPLRRFFGEMEPVEQEVQSIGSGVIVDATKGYVLTNHHVVKDADTIKVRLSDDRIFDAKLIGSDPDTDIAVLQITADRIRALPLGDSDKVEIGDFVVAIGNPFGIGQTVTSGIVSATGRSGLGARYEDFIQTDASINPGNSGGALVNLKGELIGINTASFNPRGSVAGNIGLGFAISSKLARFALKEIIATGSVVRGRIGIGGQNVDPDLAKAFGLPAARGAAITQVVPDSPAAKAGLKAEDIILEADGTEVRDFDQLRNLIGLRRVGDRIQMKVLRDGKPLMVTVVVGKNTEQAVAAGAGGSGAKLHPRLAGAVFVPVDETTAPEQRDVRGVLVQRIQPRSPAAGLRLRPGDIIIGVNRQRIQTLQDFEKLANADQKQLLLLVRRGNNAFFVVVQ